MQERRRSFGAAVVVFGDGEGYDRLVQDPASDPPRPAPPVLVDDSRDLDIGPLDILLGALTFPLLLWVLQYAFTGSEKVIATRRARYRLYTVLLAVELLVVALAAWWLVR